MSTQYPWLKEGIWPENVPKEVDFSNENRTLIDVFIQTKDKFPNKPYLYFAGKSFTYTEIFDQIQALATELTQKGVTKDDTIAILLPNTVQFVISFFAAQYLGCIASLLNPLHVSEELKYHINDSKATILISADFLYDKVIPIKAETKLRLVILTNIGDVLPSMKAFLGKKLKKIPVGTLKDPEAHNWKKVLADGAKKPKVQPNKIKNTDTALLIYTGGTTGVAKGAELSHFNVISNCMGISDWTPEPINENDVFMGALPFFHSFGMTVALLASTYFGCGLVLAPNPRDLASLLADVQKYKVTYYPGVPTMYIGLLNFKDTPKYDLSSIKFCFSGAAPLPVEVQTQFEALTGCTMLEGYGMTELSPIATSNPPGRNRKGSIGIPVPNTIVRLVDLESGSLVPLDQTGPDHIGEIVVAGPQVMKGYYNKPEESSSSLKTIDGTTFMHTGDIGYMDQDGYFYIVDRKKDMIIVSGFKVFPRDVEEAIYKHPSVKQVAVVGVPDERTTERVKAFIELKEGTTCTKEEMFKYCEENLANYRRPKEIEFRGLGEFTTLVGKVLRRKLRE